MPVTREENSFASSDTVSIWKSSAEEARARCRCVGVPLLRDGLEGPTETAECDPWRSQLCYATETHARKATQALLLRLNGESPRAEVEAASFGALLDRYIEQELSERYSTRKSHLSNIRVHIRPRWGEYPVDKMKPMAMEQWLRDLPLAPKSKTHVRGIMHLVFKCAERWGIIEIGKNPVSLVRVKNASKRSEAATGSRSGRVL